MYSSRFLSRICTLISLPVILAICALSAIAQTPYRVRITTPQDQPLGSITKVDVMLDSADSTLGLAAFDLTIWYDWQSLGLLEVSPGDIIANCGWDYFTYDTGPNGDCHGTCRAGDIRVRGSGGTCIGPVPGAGVLPASLFSLKFHLTSDPVYDCMVSQLWWVWTGCEDNILTPVNSTVQLIGRDVYARSPHGQPVYFKITDSLHDFPSESGVHQACSQLHPGTMSRSVDFYSGLVDYLCTDSFDARGDINLNGLPYEIADYSLFESSFLYGASVFTVDPTMQVAATDVNADDRTMRIGDLVYLGLVIEGDMPPHPKLVPNVLKEASRFYPVGDTLYVQTPWSIGGLFFIFDGNVQPTSVTDQLKVEYHFDGAQTRVLVLDSASYKSAHIGSQPILTFPNMVPPVVALASDTAGWDVPTEIDSPTDVDHHDSNLPSAFALNQNFPNPFNPTTTISFSMPRASAYIVSIYDMTGREIDRLTGNAGPGVVSLSWDGTKFASGVYLYKLTAGTWSDAKKMILMK